LQRRLSHGSIDSCPELIQHPIYCTCQPELPLILGGLHIDVDGLAQEDDLSSDPLEALVPRVNERVARLRHQVL